MKDDPWLPREVTLTKQLGMRRNMFVLGRRARKGQGVMVKEDQRSPRAISHACKHKHAHTWACVRDHLEQRQSRSRGDTQRPSEEQQAHTNTVCTKGGIWPALYLKEVALPLRSGTDGKISKSRR